MKNAMTLTISISVTQSQPSARWGSRREGVNLDRGSGMQARRETHASSPRQAAGVSPRSTCASTGMSILPPESTRPTRLPA